MLGVCTGKEKKDIAFLWLDPWNVHSCWEQILEQEQTGVTGEDIAEVNLEMGQSCPTVCFCYCLVSNRPTDTAAGGGGAL